MPCSRIGHIFKDDKEVQPEDSSVNLVLPKNLHGKNIAQRNTRRAIAIWTDTYRVLFDAYAPNVEELDVSSPCG